MSSALDLPRHRLTADQYSRMAELGIFSPEDKLELIEGELISMSPQGTKHAYLVSQLYKQLTNVVGERAEIRCQMPVQLGRFSMPEPDIAVVRPRGRDYALAHPQAADLFAVIEVAEASFGLERQFKVPLYAQHAVPAVVLVEIDANALHCFTQPRARAYQVVISARLGEPVSLSVAGLGELPINLDPLEP